MLWLGVNFLNIGSLLSACARGVLEKRRWLIRERFIRDQDLREAGW